jgi:hypothetical protein
MHVRTILYVCVLSFLISGCIGHYRYESKGNVTTASGGTSNALLYWYGDDGRLWYGRRYQAVDSGLEMNVCNATPKLFEAKEGENVTLQLPSKSGDVQIARFNSRGGRVVNLPEPKRLTPGSSCGQIFIAGQAASTEDLVVGEKPEVIILCESLRNPDRYPDVGRYAFKAITKTKVDGNVPPESVCPAQ